MIVEYHLNAGDISPAVKIFPRDSMVGFAKLSETGAEKSADDPLVQ